MIINKNVYMDDRQKNKEMIDKQKSEEIILEDENDYQVKKMYSNDEYELLDTDYVLLSEPVSLISVSPISLKDSNEIVNHIVVCGIHPSIYYFLLPL